MYEVTIISDSDNSSEDETVFLLRSNSGTEKLKPKSTDAHGTKPKHNGRSILKSENNNRDHKQQGLPKRKHVSIVEPHLGRSRQNDPDGKVFSDPRTKSASPTHITSCRVSTLQSNDVCDAQQSRILQEKRRSLNWGLLALCITAVLQGIGLPMYYPDIILLNIADGQTRVILYIVIISLTAFSTILAPFLIRLFGYKWIVTLGCLGSFSFLVSKLFDNLTVIFCIAPVMALLQGPYQVALSIYILTISFEYASYSTASSYQYIYCVYTGFFFTWILAAPLFSVGMLRILQTSTNPVNHTADVSQWDIYECGSKYCWTNLSESSDKNLNMTPIGMQSLFSIYIICSLAALILAVLCLNDIIDTDGGFHLLDSSTFEDHDTRKKKCCLNMCPGKFDISSLVASISKFGNTGMLLAVPLFVFLGSQHFLFYAVYLEGYVQCSLTTSLGVAMCFAGFSGIMATPLGWLTSKLGRVKLTLPATVILFILFISCLFVTDLPTAVHYTLALLWAVASCGIHIVASVTCGLAFMDSHTAIFANFHFLQLMGQLFVIVLQVAHVCNRVIFAMALLMLVTHAVSFVSMEIRTRLEARESQEHTHIGLVPLAEEATWLPRVNPVKVCQDRTEALFIRPPVIKSSNLL